LADTVCSRDDLEASLKAEGRSDADVLSLFEDMAAGMALVFQAALEV